MRYFLIAINIFSTTMCRKPFEPPAIKASNHFLAVDGIINTGPFSSTSITLSRSLNLFDTITNLPELDAQVQIQSSSGAIYPLADTGASGTYVSVPLNLDPNQKYKLSVTISSGNKYLSDFLTPKAAPPIDSITYLYANNPLTGNDQLLVYINAHDATNNTRYYRWDYTETWQHQSIYQTIWGLKDGLIYPLGPGESTFNCWSNAPSTNILLGTSIALSQDVISEVPLASFQKNDPRLDVKYSMLVHQYPLDFNAYTYWITVQKNSQQLGGLFDPQPAQIRGNMHGVTNPADPVLGYITASSISEKRIFIDNPGWISVKPDCPMKIIPTDPSNEFIYTYADTTYALYHFISGPPPVMLLTGKSCLDCRIQGGSTTQPAFWQ